MFYSETLLSKTGPLARVWLAANIERKLTKQDIHSSDITSSVNAIVDQGQAPMALRLSGQLLLGVARIYSRKARYLLDDCSEALTKIKLAFSPGSTDLPADHSHAANPASLLLPDGLTEVSAIHYSDILFGNSSLLGTQNPTLLDFGTSQLLSESIEDQPFEHGLELDLEDEYSIERGRNAPAGRTLAEEVEDTGLKFGEGDDLDLDIGEEPLARPSSPPRDSPPPMLYDDDLRMDDGVQMDIDMDAPIFPQPEDEGIAVKSPERQRDEDSPLSEIRPSQERELELSFRANDTTLEATEEFIQEAQRAKRRRVLLADVDTEMNSSQIRAQQNDRSKILKPTSFLPRDPVLLALMNMQKSGGFVSNILGDGRNQGWAPELRGILSVEVVKRSGNLKRKRDSGVADLGISDEDRSKSGASPRLEFDQEDLVAGATDVDMGTIDAGMGGDTTLGSAAEIEQLPVITGREDVRPDDDEPPPVFDDHFDETTIPLLHPEDAGPVSQGTVHAVHLLREQFGDAAADSPSQRQKKAVQFQDLLPEELTTRSDATKMFFEILVLATKDAIAVEKQDVETIGGPIKIRAKRGLWGAWAEAGTGTQTQAEEVEA